MNKRILATAILVSLSAASASATEHGESGHIQTFETQLCIAAATQDMNAVKAIVSEQGLSFRKVNKSVTCNEMSLMEFAEKHSLHEHDPSGKDLTIVAINNDLETKICLESLSNGVENTAKKYNANKDYIRCNGKPLPRFVNERNGHAAS